MKKSVYFIGIGGAGMSALARYFLSQNWAVLGSDLAESGIVAQLRKEGAKVKIGQKNGNITAKIDLIIYSQAIRPENPELQEARRLNINTLSYPKVIGELTRKYKTIAIAGAHGKSTTTALAALVLQKGGLDPTVIVGANLKEFGGKNFRAGDGKNNYLVLEADEFGRAFLHYSPTYTIITNIDREHLDIYKNLIDIKKTFLQLIVNTHDGGTVVINRDNKYCYSLKEKITAIARNKKLKIIWYSLYDSAAKKIQKKIPIPGKHNISNALAVYYLGKVLGVSEKNILAATGAYQGISRRMEYRGEMKTGISVYDDYAHHPTEIKATLQAFREKFPKSTTICVFQPHQAKRLTVLFKEFQKAFDDADITIVLPLYKVPGRDEASPLDSEKLVSEIKKRQPKKSIFYLDDPMKIKTTIAAIQLLLKQKSNLIMMGAGNIVQYTDNLLTS